MRIVFYLKHTTKRNDVIDMKQKINKMIVENQFIQFASHYDANVKNDDCCDYVDLLRNEIELHNAYFATMHNDMILHRDDYAFVVIVTRTQIEYVLIYNSFFNYIKRVFIHTQNIELFENNET